jgi:hypothetical protein
MMSFRFPRILGIHKMAQNFDENFLNTNFYRKFGYPLGSGLKTLCLVSFFVTYYVSLFGFVFSALELEV